MSIVCFAKKLSSPQSGTSLLFGALCPAELLPALEKNLQALDWQPFSETRDPYTIDLYLAHTAETVCPSGTLAAALSVNAWTDGPISGGVIGSPHEEPVSADESLEKLAGGFWCWSRPGSPGFVIGGSCEDAIRAKETLCIALEKSVPLWPVFEAWLKANRHIRKYLFLLDGCGQQGMLAAGDENNTVCLHL